MPPLQTLHATVRKSLQRCSLWWRKWGLEKHVKSGYEKTPAPTQNPFYNKMTWLSQQISGEGSKIFRIATQEMVEPWWDPASGIHSSYCLIWGPKSSVGTLLGHRKEDWRKASLLVCVLRHDGLCKNIKGPHEVEVHTTGPMKEVACHRGLLWNSSKQSVEVRDYGSWMTDEWAADYISLTPIQMWTDHKVHI